MPKPNGSLTAERAIVGALLRSDSAIWSCHDTLAADHFSTKILGQIYGAIRDLAVAGKRITLQSIVARIGEEYGEGQSTINLLGALLTDAEKNDLGSTWLDFVEDVVDAWRARRTRDLVGWVDRELGKEGTHASDVLADLKQKIQAIEQASQSEPVKWIGDIARRAVSASGKAQEGGFVPGFTTGLASLDEIIGRIFPGDLGFVLARPGDGKTVIGSHLAMRATECGIPSVFFQLEMRDEDMARRALAGLSGASVGEIEEGALDFIAYENLLLAQQKLATLKLAIDDRPKLAIEQIRERCIGLKRAHGIGCVVVDHVRLIRTLAKFRDRFERVEFITGELKAMAKELGVAVIALSQVTRSSQRRDDPTPQLADGDGGSSIEQDADWAVALFRRDRWLRTQEPHDGRADQWEEWKAKYAACKGQIEITGLKRRRGEDGVMRKFIFNGRAMRIEEIER